MNRRVSYLSRVKNDADVDELHSWGSRTNPGKAKINSTAAKTANKEDKDEKRSTDKGDLINEFTTSRDTPRDMAEYIFWTGDEKGVTTAIKEFVDQGLVTYTWPASHHSLMTYYNGQCFSQQISPSEGITFLEEVRFFLGQMQQRYGPIMDAGIEATAVHNKAQTEKLKYKTSEDDSSDAKAVAAAANSVMKSISKNHHGDANEKSKHQGEILVTSFGAKDRITADKPTEVAFMLLTSLEQVYFIINNKILKNASCYQSVTILPLFEGEGFFGGRNQKQNSINQQRASNGINSLSRNVLGKRIEFGRNHLPISTDSFLPKSQPRLA